MGTASSRHIFDLVDISDISYLRGGERGYGATERGGVGFVLKIPRGGGSPRRWVGRRAGKVSAGVWGGGVG